MRVSLRLAACAALAFSGCAATPAPEKFAFMTNDMFDGNLVGAAGDPTLDGPAAADFLCNRAAAVANRGGTWTAWISVGDGANLGYAPTDTSYLSQYPHASYRLAAIDRIAGDGPWHILGSDTPGIAPSDTIVFADRTALATGGQHEIWYTEFASLPDSSGGVATWTGTRTDGQPASWDCNGWTDSGANLGLIGAEYDSDDTVDIGPTWTDDLFLSCFDKPNERCPSSPLPANRDAAGLGAVSCSDRAHLYCFEN